MYNQFSQFCPKFDALEVKNGICRLLIKAKTEAYQHNIRDVSICSVVQYLQYYCTYLISLVFVRDGILSVADYNLTLMGVVFVVVVMNFFMMG